VRDLNFYVTPLIKLKKLSFEFNMDVYAKLEFTCPTGSHKDRESLAMIEDALNKGIKDVAIASTGNAAISLSAFSLAYNLNCHVFASKNISKERLNLIKAFKAKLHLVKGDYRKAMNECERFIELSNAYNANPGKNDKKIEGDSIISIEISNQLKLKPETIIVPTNNGTLFAGVWRGFKKIGFKPKMIAVVCPNTKIAESIAGYNRFDSEALDAALLESNGEIIEVTDNEIIWATNKLIKEGIFCEPAAASTLAALYKIKENIHNPIVLLITGIALKYPINLKTIISKIKE